MGGEQNNYLIIAGSYNSDGESRAYTWGGTGTVPVQLQGISFPGLNPEGIAISKDNGVMDFFVVSDDGTLRIGDVECKRLKDPAQRQFRGYLLLR